MYRSFRLRPVTRRRLAWLAMVMLLWQQIAVAAYACTLVPEAARATAVATVPASAMGAMALDEAHCDQSRETPAAPLCQKHCLPDHFTQVDAPAASVPFLAVPAAFPPITVAAAATGHCNGRFDALERRRAAPSPLQLYCSLLI